MLSHRSTEFRWLPTGDETFAVMLAAIEAAKISVRQEVYIVDPCPLAEKFRDALVRAAKRGVKVRVLIDAWGSQSLTDEFWQPLVSAGGEQRWFNPLALERFAFRDHRKLLVCDDRVAFVGGFNIAPEYEGDGVSRGWCDIGLQIIGTLSAELATSFDQMFGRASFVHKRFMRFSKLSANKTVAVEEGKLLLSGPGRGFSPIKRALKRDLELARNIQIIAAYFLPTWTIRNLIVHAAKHGNRVQLILPAKSDVPISQLATRVLYHRLLRAGVEIYEYQPQILHAKLVIIDDMVYAGSCNLDLRSLHFNYELLVRATDPALAAQARDIFARTLKHCRRVERIEWRRSRTFWSKLKEQWAYIILARFDPWVARWQLKLLS